MAVTITVYGSDDVKCSEVRHISKKKQEQLEKSLDKEEQEILE